MITRVVTDGSNQTAVYYDETGQPMIGFAEVRNSAFADRIVTETCTLLKTGPGTVS